MIFKLQSIEYQKFDDIVKGGQSLSPAQMNDLRMQGVSISSTSAMNAQDDGGSNEVPYEYLKNVDPAQLWANGRETTDRIKKGIKSKKEV